MADGNGLDGIAIIGMAGRFPRSRDLAELWRNLREGRDCISRFADDEIETAVSPETLRNPAYVKARGVLEEVDLFDARFFDIAPRQAELMDPQHRLFLEHAHQALEDAGHDPERFPGPIGVFGGVTLSTYFLHHLATNPELLESIGGYQAALGTDRDYLTTFVSYKLNLRGPSFDVQTACSTSLVATVLACQSLLAYQCDLALAGGVSIKLPQKTGYFYTPGGLDSSDGYCRAFDARADGSVYGSGVGVVALRRLEDALADGDPIRAVILGSAINNDGAARVGFTAPGVDGQAEAIATAQALAGVDPESIGYVECHGTGTALGDPIEVAALTKAFQGGENGAKKRGFCALGSIKTNIGHCSAAAGVAGLMKTVLALENQQIPPSLHFERPNPVIDFASGPFYVSTALADWPAGDAAGPRRAGVSSFGLGGTNAHAVLQEAPEPEPTSPSRPWQLLLLSAKSEAALEAMTDRLAAHLEEHPEEDLADVAFTLQTGRRIFPYRRALVCRDAEEGRRWLAERDGRRLLGSYREPGNRPVAFLLPGVGDHYRGMARGLYESEPAFREELDRCADLFQPLLGVDLREVIGLDDAGGTPGIPAGDGPDLRRLLGRGPAGEPDEATQRLNRTLYAQPAVFAVEYALARLWMAWGIRPDALLGYSLGEYVAACLAEVFSLEDAVRLVAERARRIDALPPGGMLAVPLSEERLRPLLGEDLDLAAVNGPGVCVAAGPPEAVAALEARLAGEGTPARRLPLVQAFHSRWMEPAAAELTRLARGIRLSPPRIPIVSNVTGTWLTPAESTDPAYWARHLTGPVRFAEGVTTLWKNPARVLLEVGPGFGLSTLALQLPSGGGGEGESERLAVPSMRNPSDPRPDDAFLLETLGRLWLAGLTIDWAGFYADEKRRRVRLPTYPFERSRFWIEPGRGAGAGRPESVPVRSADPGAWLWVPTWKRTLPPAGASEDGGAWVLLMDREGVGEELARRLEARGREVIRVPAEAPEDFPALLRELRVAGKTVDRIVHLGNITADAAPALRHPAPLLLALAEAGLERPLTVGLVANHLGEVTGGEPIDPSRAPLLVPVLGKPLANLTCRAFDLAPRPDEDDLDLLVEDLERDGGEPLVAFRGGLRWVRTWERAEAPADAQALRPGGTYLIAGPLDAIGFALASEIARETKGRLVLTDPPTEESLKELRALGAEVLTAPSSALSLHGILDLTALHPTGTPEEAVRAAAARLGRLGALAAGSRPDFCLLLAPLASLLGSPENPAAAATALFLEHLAQASRRNTPIRCTVVNLDPTGAEDHAVEVFRRALAVRGADQIAVSPEDLALRVERSRQEGETLAPGRSGATGTPGGRHARPTLRNAYVPPSTEIETRIAAIFQELLGIEAVGVHDSFFELGGHSLLATQVVSRLRDRLGVELPAPVLFEEPSVAGLAGRVERERESAPAAPAPKLQARRRSPGAAENLLARLDQLSDAEVQELLRQKRAALAGEEAP